MQKYFFTTPSCVTSFIKIPFANDVTPKAEITIDKKY